MLTKTSEYALRMTIVLATENRIMNVPELIKNIEVPETYAKKILNRLVKANVLISTKGVCGGYSLSRDPKDISVYDICSALREPILTEPAMEDMVEISVFLNAILLGETRYVFDNYTLAQIVQLNKRNLVNRNGQQIKLVKKKVTRKEFNHALNITDGTILPLHPAHREVLETNKTNG